MDVVPDMDDLLNELEAAETNGKLKYDTNDPVANPKLVLLNSSNDFNDKQNATHEDHVGMSIIVGKFRRVIKSPKKYYNNSRTWKNS